ncbi:MAG: hypothetical protein JWN24_706 [Phycisphaerales bacterium]|nr:hypothetical protein [Phycisphaerales bacterium]
MPIDARCRVHYRGPVAPPFRATEPPGSRLDISTTGGKMPVKTTSRIFVFVAFTLAATRLAFPADAAPQSPPDPKSTWQVGTPIVTYYAGPAMSEAVATQMADGGFNVVWCGEKDLDLLQKHALRGMLHDPLLSPASLDSPPQLQKLDALIVRVRAHPAFYSYYITDEPSASAFPALGKVVAHLKEKDPAHMAYINLFPTYATNEQLGTKGDKVPAYREYLRQYFEVVKPALVSYDHYQFYKAADTHEYFLNLDLVRKASQDAGVPFLNIVQAAAWQPDVRVPSADETRYLVYTTAAYGAQGISYYVYTAPGHEGGIAAANGTPTPIYATLKTLNPEFVAVATELQPLRSLAVYHTTMKDPGCIPLPPNSPFHPTAAGPEANARGLLLGYFARPDTAADKPTHVVVVNLDYKSEARTTLIGPAGLEVFNATTGKWSAANGARADLVLPPGGGKLVRVGQ